MVYRTPIPNNKRANINERIIYFIILKFVNTLNVYYYENILIQKLKGGRLIGRYYYDTYTTFYIFLDFF